MTRIATPPVETPSHPLRPWWRLHGSTWAVAALVAALLVAVNRNRSRPAQLILP